MTPLRQGLRDGLPFAIALVPFGLLFGAASAAAGLSVLQATSFSVAVIAGASQFTALALMKDGAPALIVLATALAVNLRMAMYSAALAPHLGTAPLWQRALAAYGLVDATFACADAAFRRHAAWSVPDRMAYLGGVAIPVCLPWFALTILGALVGAGLPAALPLDMAVPLCFIAMVAPGLRTLPQAVAALTSVAGALLLAFMPYGTGLLVAALLAILAGAETERRWGRPA